MLCCVQLLAYSLVNGFLVDHVRLLYVRIYYVSGGKAETRESKTEHFQCLLEGGNAEKLFRVF